MRKPTNSTWCSLALLANSLGVVSSFAYSSSNSPKRQVVTNQKQGAQGFGKVDNSVPTTHTRDDSPSTQNLLNFLLQWKSEGLGNTDAGSEVGYDMTTGMRGMYATKPFKKNDIICKIPSDVALALSDPNSSELVTPIEAAVNFLHWYNWNEQTRPMWTAYLDTLPTRDALFDPTPDFWSEEEIQAMEFPLAIKMAMNRRQQLMEVSEKSNIPVDDLQFATWIVSSRAFSIKISIDDPLVREGAVSTREQTLRVLLPYLDMINHSSDDSNAELHLIDPEKDDAWFAIRATRPIKKGKEIRISYGEAGVEATSIGLLMNYGFVPDENKFDSFLINKGGDDCIENLHGWSTTLEEDEAALAAGGDSLGNMANVLRLRAQLKKSYPSE